jgi:hypothetical protein
MNELLAGKLRHALRWRYTWDSVVISAEAAAALPVA